MIRMNGRNSAKPCGSAAARSNVVNTQSFWAGMRKSPAPRHVLQEYFEEKPQGLRGESFAGRASNSACCFLLAPEIAPQGSQECLPFSIAYRIGRVKGLAVQAHASRSHSRWSWSLLSSHIDLSRLPQNGVRRVPKARAPVRPAPAPDAWCRDRRPGCAGC